MLFQTINFTSMKMKMGDDRFELKHHWCVDVKNFDVLVIVLIK